MTVLVPSKLQSEHLDDLVGIPFLRGGRTGKGLDCYGIVLAVSTILDLPLPDVWDSAEDAYDADRNKTDFNRFVPEEWYRVDGVPTNPDTGDLLLIPGHVSIYAFGYVYSSAEATNAVRHKWRPFFRLWRGQIDVWRHRK